MNGLPWIFDEPLFRDRFDAGRQLARELRKERGAGTVVVGLARGGVQVASEVARELDLPLDVVAVRKIGHRCQPEYAIGAVAAGDGVYVRGSDGLTEAEVAEAMERARARAEELDRCLHAARRRLDLDGKTVLLVDDGLATGATMIAAVRWARSRGAGRVVAAVPVAARPSAALLQGEADELVCPHALDEFRAVGVWYRDFPQVGDEEVLRLLGESQAAELSTPPGTRERGVSVTRPPYPIGRREATIPAEGAVLPGSLALPADAFGVVLFAHGSGSSRHSPRNVLVAGALNEAGLATLLFDLLTPGEALERENVFDIPLLAGRLLAATAWVGTQEDARRLPLGYFGASTGAAAALWAAAGDAAAHAVVSRGGRPDLAQSRLPSVRAPTLLIVGELDELVLELNQAALDLLPGEAELRVVPGATHLFEEPGALEKVARLAQEWFVRQLG